MADARPKTVSLFATCLVDQFFPEVGEGAVKVFHHLVMRLFFSRLVTRIRSALSSRKDIAKKIRSAQSSM